MSQATNHRQDSTLGAIGREVADDAVRLVRAEIELAKAQFKAAAIRLALALVLFVLALTLLFVGIIVALGAVPAHYSQSIFGNDWLGWVAFGGLFLVVAVALGVIGTRAALRSFRTGKETMSVFKEDAEWARGLTKRGSSES
ncbi:MAG: phage holin family protein [Candidatus Dormibacteria bacterium]